jgi:hypothetical protein
MRPPVSSLFRIVAELVLTDLVDEVQSDEAVRADEEGLRGEESRFFLVLQPQDSVDQNNGNTQIHDPGPDVLGLGVVAPVVLGLGVVAPDVLALAQDLDVVALDVVALDVVALDVVALDVVALDVVALDVVALAQDPDVLAPDVVVLENQIGTERIDLVRVSKVPAVREVAVPPPPQHHPEYQNHPSLNYPNHHPSLNRQNHPNPSHPNRTNRQIRPK